jgi:hypothetical protein
MQCLTLPTCEGQRMKNAIFDGQARKEMRLRHGGLGSSLKSCTPTNNSSEFVLWRDKYLLNRLPLSVTVLEPVSIWALIPRAFSGRCFYGLSTGSSCATSISFKSTAQTAADRPRALSCSPTMKPEWSGASIPTLLWIILTPSPCLNPEYPLLQEQAYVRFVSGTFTHHMISRLCSKKLISLLRRRT